jgi:hypothetical protein
MYRYEEIKQVHLEITSACNASCPLCLRNVFGGRVNEYLPILELTLSDVELIFPPDFVRQLDLLYLCGNYGDPMVARDTIEVLEYFRACNTKLHLGIYTNGSGGSSAWWARLAGVVDYCRFGIDGLEDTNHLYRRGTHWNKIMRSVIAFIEAGGNAEWDFIVFRHNEHQVEQARELSGNLGFKKFYVKKTYRFFNLKTGHKREDSPVYGRDGNIEYFIEAPLNPQYQNHSLVQIDHLAADQTNYRAYLDTTPINCKVAMSKKLYLSAEALAFPCCWTANIYPWYQPLESSETWQLIRELPEGRNSIDARRHPLKEIVAGDFFQKLIPERWHRTSLAEGRLEVCSRVCGDYDMYTSQFAGPSI